MVYTIGSGTIGDLVGDFVAYRSLRPCDQRLAGFPVPRVPPRKIDRAYGQIVGDLLQRARGIASPGMLIGRIIMIGDNAQTDGAAFENLCAVNDWQGTALLVDEQPHGMLADPAFAAPDQLVHLQHWHHLRTWADSVDARSIDQETVILLDIDKTLLGARGRNDRVIDDARSIAMHDAVAHMLGSAFDDAVFAEARHTFNHRRFHHLTGDNQDYVGYLCLVVGAGVWTTTALEQAITSGAIRTIDALVASVSAQEGPQAAHLHTVSAPIIERIVTGDPTPFKAFRVREYYETVARMNLDDVMPVEERLQTELVLTAEVFDVAQRWRDQGALLFALSDKPDEAALPPPGDQTALPLHHVHTHIISSIRS